jgi:hypothetical protein
MVESEWVYGYRYLTLELLEPLNWIGTETELGEVLFA